MPDERPLRLRPPTRTADAALGERLAQLARASTPTTVRLRPHRWAAPVAGVALLAASGGVAWGTHAVAHHTRPPAVVPGVRIAPDSPSGPAEVADAPESAAASGSSGPPTRPASAAGVAGHLDHVDGEASGGDRHPSEDAGTRGGSRDHQDATAQPRDDGAGDNGDDSAADTGGNTGGDTGADSATAAATPAPASSPSGTASCLGLGSSCD